MKNRSKITRRGNRKLFRKGLKTDSRNVTPPPQRGGYRM